MCSICYAAILHTAAVGSRLQQPWCTWKTDFHNTLLLSLTLIFCLYPLPQCFLSLRIDYSLTFQFIHTFIFINIICACVCVRVCIWYIYSEIRRGHQVLSSVTLYSIEVRSFTELGTRLTIRNPQRSSCLNLYHSSVWCYKHTLGQAQFFT